MQSEFDWKKIKPDALTTIEECADAMYELDGVIGRIEGQILEAKGIAKMDGIYSDPGWFHDATVALRECKRKRQRIQDRKGFLGRKKKAEAQASIERRFMSAAMKMLPAEQIKRVWDEVHSGEQA